MGWWHCRDGNAVIGDPAADYLETLMDALGGRLPWEHPGELPGAVRERLDALYIEGIGRKPTDEDLEALLGFVRG